jgi:hypothetical protein
METNKNPQNLQKKFCCDVCDYYTSNKKDYTKHQLTDKHNRLSNTNKNPQKSQKSPDDKQYSCECGKSYKHTTSLIKHKKDCMFLKKSYDNAVDKCSTSNDIDELKEIMKYIMKENCELKNMIFEQQNSTQNMMLELCKNGINNNSNNITTTNSHNKAFNLNLFLNETCKDAMNINDFVDSIQLQLSDLINVGEVGFVEGISNIIIKNLDNLDVTKRPVHCADKKREVIYIKDDDKWEKEDEQKKRLRKAIKKIAFKNEKMLFRYKEKYPDCIESKSRYSDQYNKIIIEAMGGRGDNDMEKEDKIIKNIAKKVVINKE